MVIIPAPRKMETKRNSWIPQPDLAEQLASCTFGGPLPDGIRAETLQPGSPADSYRLNAGPGGITVTAAGDRGRWNAAQTLRQILRQPGPDGALPEIVIHDQAAFASRGIMLDVSRTRVPSMPMLRRMIDLWAELKINQLQLYFEHTFAYQGHRTVWQDASPFTAAEIRETDAYCRDRGIELIPNQNSFGHMERWLRHPEYHRYAEMPNGFEDPHGVFRDHASTLDLSKNESMDFLKDLYDQLLPNFSSRTFNIGGDETYDFGKGGNAARCASEGTGAVYAEFLSKLTDEVSSRGYTPQYWADIILKYPDQLEKLSPQAVAMNWGYEADHPFETETAALAESGRRFQVCAGTSSWNGLAPRWLTAQGNLRSAAKWGLQNGAEGYLITDWGDNAHKQQYVSSLPGWFAGAAAAWNGSAGADEDIQSGMQIHLFGNAAGKEAECLLNLGKLHKENPVKLHNMSFLILPILDHKYPYYRGQYADIARHGTGRSLEMARAASEALGRPSGGIWHRQLAFTAEIMSFAAELAAPFYESGDFKPECIDPKIKKNLAPVLEEVIARYREIWLDACRPGGLEESAAGLEGVLERLCL